MIVPLTPLTYYRRADTLFGRKLGVVDGEARFTYGEFAARVDRLAGALRELGVGPSEVVSFLTFNSHQLLEGYYAVPQLGAIVNPLNIRLFPSELAAILNHARSRVLCLHRELLPLVEALRPELRAEPRFVLLEGAGQPGPDFPTLDYEALLEAARPYRADLDAIDEQSPAELFYTSGTTGQPKGVLLSHRTLALHAFSFALAMNLSEADTFMHVVPMYHANGWGMPQSVTMLGARHVMLRKFEPELFLRLIDRERVTVTMGVPTIFNAVVNCPALGQYDTSSVRVALVGGAPCPATLVEAFESRIGGRLIQGYGLTETTPLLLVANPKSDLAGDDERRRAMQSTTGLPAVGVDLRVVDADGREVPWDGQTVGEIVARGNHVMMGYYKDEAATAEAIRDGWFHTGDLAVVDSEGYVQIVDRTKDVIISGGVNVSSVEVENCLFGHPAVFECAVVAVPDERWGEVPKAVVVLKPNAQATEAELIEYCRERLAHFKAPKSVELREALPKSGTGKILKREVREAFWQGYARRVN